MAKVEENILFPQHNVAKKSWKLKHCGSPWQKSKDLSFTSNLVKFPGKLTNHNLAQT